MNLAEQTSLEALLMFMIQKGMISEDVIDVLWAVFSNFGGLHMCVYHSDHVSHNLFETASRKNDSHHNSRRRFALQILSMFGRTENEIIASKIEILRQVGLADSTQV
jgi:hypothetical protein